jgi:hypothetical protein
VFYAVPEPLRRGREIQGGFGFELHAAAVVVSIDIHIHSRVTAIRVRASQIEIQESETMLFRASVAVLLLLGCAAPVLGYHCQLCDGDMCCNIPSDGQYFLTDFW